MSGCLADRLHRAARCGRWSRSWQDSWRVPKIDPAGTENCPRKIEKLLNSRSGLQCCCHDAPKSEGEIWCLSSCAIPRRYHGRANALVGLGGSMFAWRSCVSGCMKRYGGLQLTRGVQACGVPDLAWPQVRQKVRGKWTGLEAYKARSSYRPTIIERRSHTIPVGVASGSSKAGAHKGSHLVKHGPGSTGPDLQTTLARPEMPFPGISSNAIFFIRRAFAQSGNQVV